MTNQNSAAQAAEAQTVLSFDERERILCQFMREPINHDREMAIAIETAVLTKLRAPVADAGNWQQYRLRGSNETAEQIIERERKAYADLLQSVMGKRRDQASAPVADERQAVAYLDLGTGGYMDMDTDLTDEELAALPKGRHMLAIIGTHGVNGYTPVSAPIVDEWAVETFAERFALALKPVAYTTKRGAVYLGKSTQVGSENLCTISQAVYEFRAALASAPVAGEAVYTLSVKGVFHNWKPTTAAFSVPDGEHQLFLRPAAPQVSECECSRKSKAVSDSEAQL